MMHPPGHFGRRGPFGKGGTPSIAKFMEDLLADDPDPEAWPDRAPEPESSQSTWQQGAQGQDRAPWGAGWEAQPAAQGQARAQPAAQGPGPGGGPPPGCPQAL